jgi:hypothetical protein
MSIALVYQRDNDLAAVLQLNGIDFEHYESVTEALQKSSPETGLLVLADTYPEKSQPIEPELLEEALKRKRQIYFEFPAALPGETEGQIKSIKFERTIVSSDIFSPQLEKLRIAMIHGCRYLECQAESPLLVQARVAGFNIAVYGIPEDAAPILFRDKDSGMLIATTRLSSFVSGRYSPAVAWQIIWNWILKEINGSPLPDIKWKDAVSPSGDENMPVNDKVELNAAYRGVEWFEKARLFIGPEWSKKGQYDLGANQYPDGAALSPCTQELSCGDGSLGMIEGVNSEIFYDGSQNYRYVVRADCMGEVSFATALGGRLFDNNDWLKISDNLNKYIYFDSYFAQGPRADSKSPTYGLVCWMGNDVNDGVYYGDDNARLLLGSIGASAVLDTDKYFDSISRCLLANLRTTGKMGFRQERLEDKQIQEKGWRYFYESSPVHYAPHFESYLWACYLWAYCRSGYEPFLKCAKTGIENMLTAYPDDWHWTNGIQQERARMLLPLAWLVRIEDTAENREKLQFMAREVLRTQNACGAIQEELGDVDKGGFIPCPSNEAYGTAEAPLIQSNEDQLSDLLYTTNFAFFGLHEAVAATGNEELKRAEDKLAAFLCRIQVSSSKHEDLDGAWFRAFDFRNWEYWASNADSGWGAWSVESGWTQSWISATLMLRSMKTSFWDLTSGLAIEKSIKYYSEKML